MSNPQFRPGFRLSTLDVVVLVLGIGAAVAFWQPTWWIGFVIAFVIGHFFLFCNVFRLARPLELTWSGVFVALAAGTIVANTPGWPATIVVSLIATATVVIIAIRQPAYHGIYWRQINPGLPQWWESHIASNTRNREHEPSKSMERSDTDSPPL